MGLLVKFAIEDAQKGVVETGYLDQGFEDEASAIKHIDDLRNTYDANGYEARHARWWGRNNDEQRRIHYWWVEPPKPPA